MYSSTRSKKRGAAVSINTIVSSSEQGKDSMATNIDDDAEGSIGEAVGHNILSEYGYKKTVLSVLAT